MPCWLVTQRHPSHDWGRKLINLLIKKKKCLICIHLHSSLVFIMRFGGCLLSFLNTTDLARCQLNTFTFSVAGLCVRSYVWLSSVPAEVDYLVVLLILSRVFPLPWVIWVFFQLPYTTVGKRFIYLAYLGKYRPLFICIGQVIWG